MKLARLFILFGVLIASQQALADDDSRRCHWWQFGHCGVEGRPHDAPNADTLITIDVATNKIYLFQDGELVDQSSVATGSEKILRKGKRVWVFHTPRGRMKVLRKVKDPVWRKPDWAYIEEGKPIPPPDSPSRDIKGHLGKYALDLGGGILIHGTDEAHSIGRRVSHGCVRVPNDMLETVWKATKVGTDVYIFESAYTQTAMSERHSDLDF